MTENSDLLRQALAELSKDERLICIWTIAGFAARDIAHHTGRSEAAVTAMFANARRKLRRRLRSLGAQGYSDDDTHHDS